MAPALSPRVRSLGIRGAFEVQTRSRPLTLSRAGRVALALSLALSVVLVGGRAAAVQFGPDEAFTLRGRFYTQLSIATEPTKKESNGTALNPAGAVPSRNGGDLIQHRNFMNPEFEVDFRRLMHPLEKWLDELQGRVALWGFYDGI